MSDLDLRPHQVPGKQYNYVTAPGTVLIHYCFRNVYGVSHHIFMFLIAILQLMNTFLIFKDDTKHDLKSIFQKRKRSQ